MIEIFLVWEGRVGYFEGALRWESSSGSRGAEQYDVNKTSKMQLAIQNRGKSMS